MPNNSPHVLLVIDVQKGFVTPCSQHIVEPLESLQYDFDHVVFARFYNPDRSPFRRILKYYKLAPQSAEAQLALEPRPDATFIDRPLYTCVTPALLAQLKAWDADTVHIAGIATEACVLKTAVDLFEHDIRPLVLEDMCASDKGAEFHDTALKVIGKLIDPGNIIHSGLHDAAPGQDVTAPYPKFM